MTSSAEGFSPWLDLETLIVEWDGGAVRIVLDRPETINAWVPQLGLDLREALTACEADDVRAVELSGSGRGFSSGADLGVPTGMTSYEILTTHYHDVFLQIRALEKPVVASVHGAAAGVGCSLALCCDLVLMAESSFLLLAFVNIGLVPDGGASLFVPRRAGGGRALEMALLGERVPAAKALEWGLATRVHPDAEHRAESVALLRRLADGPTRAYAGIKRELNATVFAGLEEQLELEARVQDEAERTADHAEGAAAFLEKRPSRYTGA